MIKYKTLKCSFLLASALSALFICLSFKSNNKRIARYLMKDKCYGYEYMRRYLSDSVFVESYFNVSIKDTMINDTFKISNGIWYYCLDGEYEVLFSREKFDKKEISRHYFERITNPKYLLFRESHMAYEPLYKEQYRGREVWVYYFYSWGTRSAIEGYIPNEFIYFDPQVGIVKKEQRECGISEMDVLEYARD